MQSFSAKIDKSLFERLKKTPKNKAWKNWLCHFWRTLTFSDQEGKNCITHEKLHSAEELFLFNAALSSCSIA